MYANRSSVVAFHVLARSGAEATKALRKTKRKANDSVNAFAPFNPPTTYVLDLAFWSGLSPWLLYFAFLPPSLTADVISRKRKIEEVHTPLVSELAPGLK
jgi:hypothetical protein